MVSNNKFIRLSIAEKKELLGVSLKINARTGEVYTEKTNIKRKREGRKIITEYRHEKESLGNIFEK
jgi:hypothetical protein